ncbi:hypothetical protein NTE_01917 [Candidatus Nitrososphaera evergladensis SR1]|uniref:Uncharacterized protein n=1 Tax=Candidatus Nitrososphaera evergladensis SR1 TaxID=1459636 RepID=A0A075MQZ7_9ARCH|nr:hypothetical protein NTE_01917 [Candidatus Nitrososphaera evergladensis SR1]
MKELILALFIASSTCAAISASSINYTGSSVCISLRIHLNPSKMTTLFERSKIFLQFLYRNIKN